VHQQYEGFAARLGQGGFRCPAFTPRPVRGTSRGWLAGQQDLIDWLRDLPKPVGILTWATRRGREVLDACRCAGLLVPEQVAVLGGDDDELLCEVCSPSLSGIVVASEQIGHEAAALLDRLLLGRRPPRQPMLIAPVGVVTRQSTDTLAIENAAIAQAIRFIREHAAEPITVRDVLREVPISRRQLERQFQDCLGRSPATEIRRVHLERAKSLLTSTDLPIPQVASGSGFGTPEYLACVLKNTTGLSPVKYRSQFRGR
jgi:LacI family transcriptional regulator